MLLAIFYKKSDKKRIFLSKRMKMQGNGQENEKKACNLHFVMIYYLSAKRWPIGQAVKTLASHAGNSGSIPGWVTRTKKGHSIECPFFVLVTHPLSPAQSALRFGFGFAFAAKAVWELAHKRLGVRIFVADEIPGNKPTCIKTSTRHGAKI